MLAGGAATDSAERALGALGARRALALVAQLEDVVSLLFITIPKALSAVDAAERTTHTRTLDELRTAFLTAHGALAAQMSAFDPDVVEAAEADALAATSRAEATAASSSSASAAAAATASDLAAGSENESAQRAGTIARLQSGVAELDKRVAVYREFAAMLHTVVDVFRDDEARWQAVLARGVPSVAPGPSGHGRAPASPL